MNITVIIKEHDDWTHLAFERGKPSRLDVAHTRKEHDIHIVLEGRLKTEFDARTDVEQLSEKEIIKSQVDDAIEYVSWLED